MELLLYMQTVADTTFILEKLQSLLPNGKTDFSNAVCRQFDKGVFDMYLLAGSNGNQDDESKQSVHMTAMKPFRRQTNEINQSSCCVK